MIYFAQTFLNFEKNLFVFLFLFALRNKKFGRKLLSDRTFLLKSRTYYTMILAKSQVRFVSYFRKVTNLCYSNFRCNVISRSSMGIKLDLKRGPDGKLVRIQMRGMAKRICASTRCNNMFFDRNGREHCAGCRRVRRRFDQWQARQAFYAERRAANQAA